MRNFYIVVPALSLLNMGVNGATIANTLTARGDAHAGGNGLHKGMISHYQNRQFHTADFSSGPDADAGAEVQTPDHPVAPASESESLTPRDVLNDNTSTDPTNALAADALSSLRSREVQPAMIFKRRINDSPHEMARHLRRQNLLFNSLNNASSKGTDTASDADRFTMRKGLALAGDANDGTSSEVKTGGNAVSKTTKPLNVVVLRRRSSTGPQRYEECDENYGERASSDTEPLAVSRGMHGLRQVRSITDDVPFADLTLGGRSDDSTNGKPDARNLLGNLPTFESDVRKHPKVSALARDLPVDVPAPLNSVTGSLSDAGVPVGRRAAGNDARGLMKVAKFKSLPVVDANSRRTDAPRMIKRKAKRQDEDEAADAEVATDIGLAGDDGEASTDDAGEGAGSLDDVD